MIAKISLIGKAKLETFFVPLVIILVGLTAFGLGRLSALESQKGELKVYEAPALTPPAPVVLGASTAEASGIDTASAQGEGKYVASKNGTRYYLPSCSGAKRINEENKVWFNSTEDARAAGFTPALNCPGL